MSKNGSPNLPRVAAHRLAAAANQPVANAPPEDACTIDCVPEFRSNTNPAVVKVCEAERVTREKCFLERERDRSFYAALNWNVLANSIKAYSEIFFETLRSDEEFLRDITTLYTYGPYVPPDTKPGKRPEMFAEFNLEPVKGDDFTFCKNLVLKLSLVRGPKKGSKEIAHISLHPARPKYTRDTLRSRSGCGYYPKTTNANRAAGEDDVSPFVYVIELIDWTGKPFRGSNPFRPTKSVVPNPEEPGTFRPIDGPFQTIFQDGFTDSSSRSPDTLTPEKRALLNSVHMRLYSKFVDFWNTTMQEGIAGVGSGSGAVRGALPSIKQTGGGARRKKRTQKQTRRPRHRTRKH